MSVGSRKRISLLFIALTNGLLLVISGCSSARVPTASDETFFTPLTPDSRLSAQRPQRQTPTPSNVSVETPADSLAKALHEQQRRIDSVATRLERLAASREPERKDTSAVPVEAPRMSTAPSKTSAGFPVRTVQEVERLYTTGEYRRALALGREIMTKGEEKGKEGRCSFIVGASYFRLKEYENAVEPLQMVLRVKGSSKRADALFLLGLTYLKLGLSERAKLMLEGALKESPGEDLARSIRRELNRLQKPL